MWPIYEHKYYKNPSNEVPPNLIAIVAGVLILAAVPGDMPSAMALVATVLLLATLAGEMSKPKKKKQ